MKISRLITYGLCGIIAGLLLENTSLTTKQKVKDKGRDLKKKAGKLLHRH